MKPELCEICGNPKTALPNPTDKQGLPVFVCTQAEGKGKMPCDGYAFKLASKSN